MALAAGLFTHHHGSIVFRQGSGKEFRRRVGIAIHQHRHGNFQAVRIGHIHIFLACIIHRTEQHTLRQQVIQHLHQLLHIAAGIGPNIENQLLGTLIQQSLNGCHRFLGTAGVKIGNGHQANPVLQHFIFCHRCFYLFPGHGIGQLLTVPQHGDFHLGTFFAPDHISGFCCIQPYGGSTLHTNDHIAHQQARFRSRTVFIDLRNGIAIHAFCHRYGNTNAHIGIV